MALCKWGTYDIDQEDELHGYLDYHRQLGLVPNGLDQGVVAAEEVHRETVFRVGRQQGPHDCKEQMRKRNTLRRVTLWLFSGRVDPLSPGRNPCVADGTRRPPRYVGGKADRPLLGNETSIKISPA